MSSVDTAGSCRAARFFRGTIDGALSGPPREDWIDDRSDGIDRQLGRLVVRGVVVREADYTKPEQRDRALEGVDRLLLISSSEVGQRAEHHRTVVDAAAASDMELLAYTSILAADSREMRMAEERRSTTTPREAVARAIAG